MTIKFDSLNVQTPLPPFAKLPPSLLFRSVMDRIYLLLPPEIILFFALVNHLHRSNAVSLRDPIWTSSPPPVRPATLRPNFLCSSHTGAARQHRMTQPTPGHHWTQNKNRPFGHCHCHKPLRRLFTSSHHDLRWWQPILKMIFLPWTLYTLDDNLPINPIDAGALVVASQQEKVLRVLYFVGKQQTDRLQ